MESLFTDYNTHRHDLCRSNVSAAFLEWTAKQFENIYVDEEHFMRFRDENAVSKFIPLRVDVG